MDVVEQGRRRGVGGVGEDGWGGDGDAGPGIQGVGLEDALEGGVHDGLNVVVELGGLVGDTFLAAGGEESDVGVDEVEDEVVGGGAEDTDVISPKGGSSAGGVEVAEEVKDRGIQVSLGVASVGVLDVCEGNTVHPGGVQGLSHIAHECHEAVEVPGDVDMGVVHTSAGECLAEAVDAMGVQALGDSEESSCRDRAHLRGVLGGANVGDEGAVGVEGEP